MNVISGNRTGSGNRMGRVMFARALEPRFMLDGAALATAIEAAPPPADAPTADSAEQSPTDTLVASLAPTDADSGPTGNDKVSGGQIAFVDSAVADFEQLVSGLPDGIEIVILDSSRDGIEQISEALAGRSGISAIHIVSHGDDGQAQLGNSVLSADTIDGFATQIAGWGAALGADADILFYGCNIASGANGENLVDQLAGLTGADIAASTDVTGAALLGGNWELEYATGTIETALPFSAASLDTFDGTLVLIDNFSVTQSLIASPGGTTSAVANADIIGGERSATITGASANSELDFNKAGSLGNLKLANAGGTSTSVIVWDGVGTGTFASTDMTEGNTQIAFQLLIVNADFADNITMTVTSGAVTSTQTLQNPVLATNVPLNFQFANFTNAGGFVALTTPGTFGSVDSITLSITTLNVNADIELNFVQTTPNLGPQPEAPPPTPAPPTTTIDNPPNLIQQGGNLPAGIPPELPTVIPRDFLKLEDSALYIGHSVNGRGDSIDNQYGANSVAIIKGVDPTEAVASTTGAQYASVLNVIVGGATGDSSVSSSNSQGSQVGQTPGSGSVGAALSGISPSSGPDGQPLTPEELELRRIQQEQQQQQQEAAPAENSGSEAPPPADGEQAPAAPAEANPPGNNGASLFRELISPDLPGVPGLNTQMATVAAEFDQRRDGLLAAFAPRRVEVDTAVRQAA